EGNHRAFDFGLSMNSMNYQDILYDIEDGVATIRFNRPQALNAMTLRMLEETRDAFAQCASDVQVRAVVLTGEGRAFSSGADLVANVKTPPLDADGKLDLGLPLETHYNPLIAQMRSLPKPIICAVNGAAAGAAANV